MLITKSTDMLIKYMVVLCIFFCHVQNFNSMHQNDKEYIYLIRCFVV